MVEDAERSGKLKPGGTIVEPTSGNTGIGLAMVAAVKGYKLILVMPDSMSIERRRLMLAYGATFDLTPKEKGMKGAIARAQEIIAETPGAGCRSSSRTRPTSRSIAARPRRKSCAISRDAPLDALITGVGTGGHITGLRRGAQEGMAGAQGVRGRADAVAGPFSGGEPGPHPIQGIGAGFIPAIMDVGLLDGVIQVDPDDAKEMARRAAREEGMLVGISSGATLAAIEQKLPELGERRACSASTTTPASAICRCPTSFPRKA